MKALSHIRKNSLKLVGNAALLMGTVSTAPLKTVLLYQPEYPKELRKNKKGV